MKIFHREGSSWGTKRQASCAAASEATAFTLSPFNCDTSGNTMRASVSRLYSRLPTHTHTHTHSWTHQILIKKQQAAPHPSQTFTTFSSLAELNYYLSSFILHLYHWPLFLPFIYISTTTNCYSPMPCKFQKDFSVLAVPFLCFVFLMLQVVIRRTS